jgi:hypothetical protein
MSFHQKKLELRWPQKANVNSYIDSLQENFQNKGAKGRRRYFYIKKSYGQAGCGFLSLLQTQAFS